MKQFVRRQFVGKTLQELNVRYVNDPTSMFDGVLLGTLSNVRLTPIGKLQLEPRTRRILNKGELSISTPVGEDRSKVRLTRCDDHTVFENVPLDGVPAFRKVKYRAPRRAR